MSTRKQNLDRHQAALEARKRLESGAYDQPQESYKSTRQRNLAAYSEQHAPLPSSFSGDPETAMLNAPRAIESFQQEHSSVQPDYLKPTARTGSIQAIQDFQDRMPAASTADGQRQAFYDREADARAEQLAGAPGFIKKPLELLGHGIDMMQANIPGLADFQRGAGQTLGVEAETAPLMGGVGGKVAQFVGQLVGGAVNPAALEQSAVTGAGRAATNVMQRYAPNVNSFAQRVVGNAAEGAVQNVANTAASGRTSGRDLAEAAAFGAGGGAAFEVLGTGVGKLLGRRGTSAGVPDDPETLALPLGREDAARARSFNAPGTEPIIPPYTFELPAANPETIRAKENASEGRQSLTEIDDQIRQHESGYQRAVKDEFDYLKSSLASREGVSQGGIVKTAAGDVTGRYGRQSNNPVWYQDWYAANGKVPSNKELYQLAEQRVNNGFRDEQGDVPGWRQQTDYDSTLTSLKQTREQIAQSIREIDPALHVTDMPIASKELSFSRPDRIRNSKSADAIPATPEAPLPEPRPLPKTPSAQRLGFSAFGKKAGAYDNLKTSTKSQLVSRQKREKMPASALRGKLYTEWVDDLHPMERFDKEVEAVTSQTLGAEDRSHTLALNSRGSDVIAKQILTARQVDSHGKGIGPSMKAILSQLPDSQYSFVDFEDYLVNKHAITRMEKRGERVFREDLHWTPDEGRKIVADYEAAYPIFSKMASEINEFQQNMAQHWLVDTGLLPQKSLDNWLEENPTYVPNKRFFSELEKGGAAKGGGKKKGFGNQSAPVKGYTPGGSERLIISPIEAMIENVDAFVKAAKRNGSMQAVVRNLEKDPDGLQAFAEFVPEEQIAGSHSLNGLNDTLHEEGIEGVIAKLGTDFDLSFRKATQRGLDKDNIVRVMIDGEPKYVQINDKPLLDAITALGPDASNVVMDFLGKVTGVFKMLTTGVNPVFSLTRNIMRDIPQAYVASKSTNNPMRFMSDLATSAWSIARNKELYQDYLNMGGGHASPTAADRNLLAQSKRQILPQRGNKLKGIIPRSYDALQNAMNAVESAPRLGEFKRVGSNPAGVAAAQDVTVNFKRKGRYGKQLDKVFPYFNAAVQGLDKTARIFKDMPPQALAKTALAVSLPAIVSYAINHNDPDYQKVSKQVKDNFYLLPKGDGTFWKIAKPKELGTVFADIPERLLQVFAQQDPDAFRGFADQIRTTFMLPGIQGAFKSGGIPERLMGVLGDTVVGPIADVAANQNFAGSPIVPGYLQNLSPELQSDPKTSILAKKIGEWTGSSPKKLDYLFRQYTGILGQIGQPLLSPGGSVGDTLIQQVTADPVYSNDITDKMYGSKDKLDQADRDANVTGKLPADYDDGMRKYLGRISDNMSGVRKQMRAIEADTKLSANVKRKQLRDLQEQINKLAQQGNEAVKQTQQTGTR